MKLRIRIRQRTERADVGVENSEDNTLGELAAAVVNLAGLDPSRFQLSLNGKDPINGDPDEPLRTFGIVAGDLIKVLLPEESGPGSNAERESIRSRPNTRVNGSINASHGQACDSGAQRVGHSSSAGAGPSGAEMSNQGNPEIAPNVEMSKEEKEAREQLAHLERETLGDPISEPMLCRDAEAGKIPLRLRQLCHENRPDGPGDALCLALHVLMVETGFYGQENNNSSSEGGSDSHMDCQDEGGREDEDVAQDQLACLPPGWKAGSSYRLHYRHPECGGLSCALAGVSFGATLLIHGLIGKKIQASTQLKPSAFANIDGEGQVTYNNLAHLSRTFKDAIAYPLLAAMREELGLPPLNGLLALVPEIQLKILSFLQLTDLITMSVVCQHFGTLANDVSLWRQLLLRDFGGKNTDRHCNWKSVYKEKYHLRKQRDQLRSRIRSSFYPPGRRPFAFVPPLPNPLPGFYPPGYRGGDYDFDPFRPSGALPGYPSSVFPPIPGPLVPGPLVPGPRHDPIFPNPEANPRPGHGGGLRDLEGGRPHPYVPQQPQGFPAMPTRRTGGRTGGGSIRGFFR